MRKILCISGKRGAGKDTLASYLYRNSYELFGEEAAILSLAQPIKDDISLRFGGSYSIMRGTNAQKEQRVPHTTHSYRQAMRTIGKAYTDLEPLHFARLFMDRAAPHDIVINQDVRLRAEAIYLKAHGAKIIRLTRAENPDDTHITECGLDDWEGFDAAINNRDITATHTQEIAVSILRQWGWVKEGVQ